MPDRRRTGQRAPEYPWPNTVRAAINRTHKRIAALPDIYDEWALICPEDEDMIERELETAIDKEYAILAQLYRVWHGVR
jgi:hypothetical protein